MRRIIAVGILTIKKDNKIQSSFILLSLPILFLFQHANNNTARFMFEIFNVIENPDIENKKGEGKEKANKTVSNMKIS